jgi:aryl-alcohol dehydrogenase-like predicted oxidoreductase
VGWLRPDELRVGLGLMRLSTEPERDEARAEATIVAALEAGVTVFDTARAYGLSEADVGHSERLLGRVLRAHQATERARIVTKGGMRRDGGRWIPDGRARSIRADCEASREALGAPIDLYLLHAPDPAVSFDTSVRALRGLLEAGLVRRIGLSNVRRNELDRALELAPIAAIQVAISPSDSAALLGGVVLRAVSRGLSVLAHTPLGGPAGARRLSRDPTLGVIAGRLATVGKSGLGAAGVALSALLEIHPELVALPGARRPETARALASAARLSLATLEPAERGALRERLPAYELRAEPPRGLGDGEVVVVMGIQGAGKSSSIVPHLERGYLRLNRDQRGGTLRGLIRALEAELAAGQRRVVLDNTFLTRACRRAVILAAWRHGLPVRGVWLDTPLAQAQINVILRILAHHGRLLDPDELRRSGDPGAFGPQVQFRALRELEPPDPDEGWSALERVAFQRAPSGGRPACFVALEAAVAAPEVVERESPPGALRLAFSWQPGSVVPARDTRLPAGVAQLVCPHPAGPPICWCRPPLPGLLLQAAAEQGLDLSASVVVGVGPAHRAMADALGARYVAFGDRA